MEFLESNEIENVIDDNSSSLKELFEKNEEKLKDTRRRSLQTLVESFGSTKKKDEEEGVFKSMKIFWMIDLKI